MRATIKNYIAALKQRREEHGESGFSLIELIVVVAILGILVAIAIPVFGAVQENARINATKAVAASAATQWASQLAAGDAPTAYVTGDAKINVTGMPTDNTAEVTSVCAVATNEDIADGATEFKSGPGCTSD